MGDQSSMTASLIVFGDSHILSLDHWPILLPRDGALLLLGPEHLCMHRPDISFKSLQAIMEQPQKKISFMHGRGIKK